MRENITPYTITLGLIGILLSSMIFFQIIVPQQSQFSNVSVKIGVVDSGCNSNQASFVESYQSFTTKAYGFFLDDTNLYDDVNHGTLVCDLIHQQAPNAKLYSARVANSLGQLTYQSILAAIEWLVEGENVDIINLSLGSLPFISSIIDEVFIKYQNQTIFVAASGNSGTSNYSDLGYVDWPAIYPWVIGVGSFSDDDMSSPAEYTVGGLSYFGTFVTEYLDNGRVGSKQGSSFSAPRVTGKLGQLLFRLREIGMDPNPNQLQALFTNLTNGWGNQQFDYVTGWGSMNFDLLSKSNFNKLNLSEVNNVIHAATNDLDQFQRFNNERWERIWKISSFNGNGISEEDIILSGNGTVLVQDVVIEKYPWGATLKLLFNPISVVGFYQLNVSMTDANSFLYGVNVAQSSIGSILFDHRLSINGLGHQYGEFSNFENYLREQGYKVNHVLFENIEVDLTAYDMLILPKFMSLQVEQNFTISRPIDMDLLEDYITFTEDGGSLVLFSNLSTSSNEQPLIDFLTTFNANYTKRDIGEAMNPPTICCPKIVSNFTSDAIADGAIDIQYIGGEVRSNGIDAIEIAWVTTNIGGPFVSSTEYLSIGVYGQLESGKFLILGGTNTITNPYFRANLKNGIEVIFENFTDM